MSTNKKMPARDPTLESGKGQRSLTEGVVCTLQVVLRGAGFSARSSNPCVGEERPIKVCK